MSQTCNYLYFFYFKIFTLWKRKSNIVDIKSVDKKKFARKYTLTFLIKFILST